jgi:hypothetical protein
MKANKISRGNAAKGKNVQTDEVYAAIALALYQEQNEVHDIEDMRLTIRRESAFYSPWSSKTLIMRTLPATPIHRK